MRKDDHLIFEALQDNQPNPAAGNPMANPGSQDKMAVSNPSKTICDKLKQVYDILQEIEEVYEDCGKKIDKGNVVSWWNTVIPEMEYMYYDMKGEYNKFNDDGEVLNSITGESIPGENAEETAEQRIAAAKQAVAQAKGQIAQAKIQGQMKHYGDGLVKALGKSENAEGQPMTQQNKMPVTYIHLDLYTGKTSVIPQREFQQAIDGLEKVGGKMTVYKGEEYMVLVVPSPGTR